MRCFIDMDGVLVRFFEAVLEREGRLEWMDRRKWDLMQAVDRTREDLFRSLPHAFWRTLARSDEFDAFLETAFRLFGEQNVWILSSPLIDPPIPYVPSAKFEWISQHCPKLIGRLILGADKRACARRDSILLDDNPRQVKAFAADGGHAILVPRPWNTETPLPTNYQLWVEEVLADMLLPDAARLIVPPDFDQDMSSLRAAS